MGRPADDTRPAAVHHRGMSSASSPVRDRRAVRWVLMSFGAVGAVAGVAIVVSVVGAHDVDTPSPKDAVRDFLVASVVDSDGVDACGYLTPGAARALRAVESRDETCHAALADTRLVLAELAQPGAPATPWRIDSSINRLAPG
jgi:hypothetical protein